MSLQFGMRQFGFGQRRGRAPAGGYLNPYEIGAIALYTGGYTGEMIDFARLDTIWQDSAGLTAGAVDSSIGRIGGLVNSNNATSAGSARPLLKSDGVKYWGQGDGVDDQMDFAVKLIPAAPPFSILMKAQFASGGVGALLHQYAGSQTGRTLITPNQSSGGSTSQGDLNPFNASVTEGGGTSNFARELSPGNDTDFVFEFVSASTGSEDSYVALNGTEIDRFTLSSVYQGVNTGLFGRAGLFAPVKFIYRMMIINRELTGVSLTTARNWVDY